ncbi:MAG TPA: penicillin acylase family protein [Nocardioides sp.]
MSSHVFHDQHGIPHISADSLGALAFAQGAEQATSRPAQLELERLRSEGRTAERVGPAGLEWDRFARRARIDAIAQRAYDVLDAETQEFLVAFTDGINATLRERRWMPWSPCGVFLVQQIHFGSFPSKLWRQAIADRLGADGLRAISVAPPTVSGSNAYAVTGARTASGAPIIAGDPHRIFEAPNVYLQTHLSCPEFDVVGFCFPGVPGVQHFAHTGSVAWGLTNAMGDYQDLYAEELRRTPNGGVEALGPDGWEAAESFVEEIRVRGELGFGDDDDEDWPDDHWPEDENDDSDRPSEVEVIVTARGPVVFGGVDSEPLPCGATALSLRTASHDLGDLGFAALLPLLRAKKVADVEAAIGHWVEPVNNWVIADTEGTVVHRVAGRVPERHIDNLFGVVPASSSEHQWTGWATLPVVRPGETGRVVSANDRATEEFSVVASHFAASWRADRIRELLDAAGPLTATDAITPLLDARQLGGEALLAAVAEIAGLGEGATELQQVLAGWDGEMSVDGLGAAAFTALRSEFTDRLCAQPVLAALADDLADGTAYGALYRPWLALATRVGQSLPKLLEHATSIGIDVGALLRESLEAVAAAVETAGGHTSWGERHRFTPLTGAAQFGLPDEPLAVSGEPLPGDMDSVAAMSWVPGSDLCVRGPVARYVWDLADRAQSRWAVPLGAHEDPDSPHRTDQFEAWHTGSLLPVIPRRSPE